MVISSFDFVVRLWIEYCMIGNGIFNINYKNVVFFFQGSRDNMSVILVAFPNAPNLSPEAVEKVKSCNVLFTLMPALNLHKHKMLSCFISNVHILVTFMTIYQLWNLMDHPFGQEGLKVSSNIFFLF